MTVSKFRPKREKDLIHLTDIKEDMKLIEGSNTDSVTPAGKVYKYYHDDLYLPKKASVNNKNVYLYVGITFSDGEKRSRRLHRLVALAFIPNPDPEHLRFVGHKDNIKHHDNVENLYWTTNQENTQKAVDDGLNNQPIAEHNENSMKVKVIDKNTLTIVGVYGSIRQCGRCVENANQAFIAKMCKSKMYKPRSKKYIYQYATDEEFNDNQELKDVKLIEVLPIDKTPKVFYLINNSIGYKKIFDNQTQASKVCEIPQAMLSHMIRNGSSLNGWTCEYIKSVSYTEASGYQNMLDLKPKFVLQHIKTNEVKEFENQQKVKDFLNIRGHDISDYLTTGHTLMNEWKVIAIENK